MTNKITVAGAIKDYNFQMMKTAALYIKRESEDPTLQVEILEFFESQWEQYMKDLKQEKKGKFYIHKGYHIAFINDDEYIGDSNEFMRWALINHRYFDTTKILIYKNRAKLAMKKAIN